jgi:hypothetical protein
MRYFQMLARTHFLALLLLPSLTWSMTVASSPQQSVPTIITACHPSLHNPLVAPISASIRVPPSGLVSCPPCLAPLHPAGFTSFHPTGHSASEPFTSSCSLLPSHSSVPALGKKNSSLAAWFSSHSPCQCLSDSCLPHFLSVCPTKMGIPLEQVYPWLSPWHLAHRWHSMSACLVINEEK